MSERDVFEAAMELPPEKRGAYLDSVCGCDAALRERLEALLSKHDRAGAFLEEPAVAMVATVDEPALSERPGTVIGPYKLMEQIGEGGMGLVFVAEQQQPVRRKVALKVIKPGMDTRQVVARFEAERQALALMDHPNIARVLDGGATASGRPYFVMELVKGLPITGFCDQNQVPVRERLELFLSVCQAVQHAHQKGIIHRDIKPSNVLVLSHDGVALVKVIDFGVAKAIGQQLTDKTIYTQFAQMVGTPLYMSPEQAGQSSLDVDTRSDIYSLGVLLYELLTGTTPFDKKRLREADHDEMRRIIREEEPPRPSTRISTLGQAASTISTQRKSDPRRLSQLMRGDLDWIVMKALEKDRNRRYETANAFAQDVQRYLADEPVLACPPSAWYRFRKFVRRNKVGLTMAAVVTAVVLLGLAGTVMVFQIREQAALDRAASEEQARKRLELSLYCQTMAVVERERSVGNAGRAEELLEGPDCPPPLRNWEWRYLKRLRYGPQAPLHHASAVLCLAVSPNGRLLATGTSGHDGAIVLWDLTTRKEVRRITAHSGPVRRVSFSPDSRRLAAAAENGMVRVWEVATGRNLLHLQHGDDGTCVAFSPDSRFLASGGEQFVKVWDTATGAERTTLHGHRGRIMGLAFSPDGARLASASDEDRIVKLWDTTTWSEVATLGPHVGLALSVSFHPDGQRLAVASGHFFMTGDDCEVKIWDISRGETLHTLRGHVGAVLAVAFSPDGTRLASAGAEDGTIKVWDVETGLETLTLRGHVDSVWSVAFSPDGRRLFSAGADHTARVWDATPLEETGGPELQTLTGHSRRVTSVAFSPDGRVLVSASMDHTIKVWDPVTGREVRTLRSHNGPVLCLTFAPDGRLLASGNWGTAQRHPGIGVIRVWDTKTWREMRSLDADAHGVLGVAFSTDGRRLIVATEDKILVWDEAASQPSLLIRTVPAVPTFVAMSPDGKRLASAEVGGRVMIWDARETRLLLTLQVPLFPAHCVGNLGAALIDFPVQVLPAHASRVTGLAFHPRADAHTMASAGADGTLKLWDTRTWKLRHEQQAHLGGIHGVAFSPDGKHIATTGKDATVRVWDTETGRAVSVFHGHTDTVYAVAYSPDGRCLASGGLDRMVRIWAAGPPEGGQ
jgi:WD40 repeat protein/serine/threonine protein kinase